MLLQAALSAVFIAFGGGFRTLINVLSVAEWGFYFLTVSLTIWGLGSECLGGRLTFLVFSRLLDS